MAQVTGKKVATTPMPTPTGTSGAIIDSFNTQDDQTVNAPSIHIVKDAITTINDNLTASLYLTSLSDISAIVDEYISSNNMTNGEKRYFTAGNYYCEITKIDNSSADRYAGIIIRAISNERYTFYKNGSTSTAVNSF